MALEIKRLHLASLQGLDGSRWPVHGFVVTHPGGAVLVDTGVGGPQRALDDWRVVNRSVADALADYDMSPADIGLVINTHLHFDHCGWNTTLTEDGRVVPTFPNARYFVHRGEVEHGHLQLERDAVSYISENYDPLIASGQMTLIEPPAGGMEIVPGVSVEVYPGHTAQMMAVMLDSGGRRACYISDLMPTSAHLDVTWVTGYDLDPLTSIEQRKRFLSRAIPERWLVLFTHDHHHPMGYVEWGAKGKPQLKPAF